MYNKYSNKKTVVGSVKLDSKLEARIWVNLQWREKSGEITDLQRQVSYELNPGGTFSYKYRADFVYKENGVTIVTDAKGYRTAEYRKKKKLMKKVHGIDVLELK